MRILVSIDSLYGAVFTGMQRAAAETCRRLVNRGHEVTVLIARAPGETPVATCDGVEVVRYARAPGPIGGIIASAIATKTLIERKRFDVVHAHFAYSAAGPAFVAKRARIPVVRSYHGSWDAEARAERAGKPGIGDAVRDAVRYATERASLRGADDVVVLSVYAADQVRSRFGIDDARVHVVRGGVDLDRFPMAESKLSERQLLGVPQDRPFIVGVGRLLVRKGFDRFIDALALLRDRNRSFTAAIVGDGPQRDALTELVRARGLEGSVRLAGRVEPEKIGAYFRAADLAVVPSLELETFGLVTLEALASGTPVVATPIGATPEILCALAPELVATSTQPGALAERMGAFFSESWARRLTPEAVRAFVVERYSWYEHAREIETLLSAAALRASGARTDAEPRGHEAATR